MNETFMKEKPVLPLMLSMALPMVLSMMVTTNLQYVMGHSDAQITMNVYNHIAEKSHVENEMSKMNLPETVPAVV